MTNYMLMLGLLSLLVLGCTPTVIETPNEPVTINLNVKIDHEVVLKVDQELDDVFEENTDIFEAP